MTKLIKTIAITILIIAANPAFSQYYPHNTIPPGGIRHHLESYAPYTPSPIIKERYPKYNPSYPFIPIQPSNRINGVVPMDLMKRYRNNGYDAR